MPDNQTAETYDRNEALTFLGSLVDDVTAPQTWQTFDDGPHKRRELARVLHGSFDKVLPELLALQGHGAGVFLTINQTDLTGRLATNVVALRSLFVDGDGTQLPTSWGCPPSLVVSRAPDRWHAYWLLGEGEPVAGFKEAQLHLAAVYGGDAKVHDLSRVMRVPGFFHLKDPNRPQVYRIQQCDPARVYTISNVVAAHPMTAAHAARLEAATESPIPVGDMAPVPDGKRHEALTSMAGSLRRMGRSHEQIRALLHVFNREQCRPPEAATEVDRIARDIARKEPDQAATIAAEGQGWKPATSATVPMDAVDMIAEFNRLRPALIDGFLRETEVANIIAPPKSGKSWLVMDMALCIATGSKWLGMTCTQGHVLMVDNELHPQTLGTRLRKVADASGLIPDDYAGRLSTWSVRGQNVDLGTFAPRLIEHAKKCGAKLIVLDALYRFLPKGSDENSNSDATALYNLLDSIAEATGSAIICIHHASKGSQAGKAVTDVGAGAGAMSRAADSHAIMRALEEPDTVAFEAVCRSWPSVPPMGLRREFPRWKLDLSVDITAEKGRPKEKEKKRGNVNVTPQEFADRYVGSIPRIRDEIMYEAEKDGMSATRADQVMAIALSRKLAYQHTRSAVGVHATFATVPPADPRTKKEQVEDYLRNHPGAESLDVATMFGCDDSLVRKVRRGISGGNAPNGNAP